MARTLDHAVDESGFPGREAVPGDRFTKVASGDVFDLCFSPDQVSQCFLCSRNRCHARKPCIQNPR